MTKHDKLAQLYDRLYEGGDEPEVAVDAPAKLSKADRKKNKYADDTAGFSAKEASPGLADGIPVQNRKMTDVCCLLFFILALVAWIGVTVVGFKNGNVQKLLAPIDQNSLICGHNTTNSAGQTQTEAIGFKYLYITDLMSTDPFSSGWCVKECPATKTAAIDYYTYPGKSAPTVEGGQYATKNFFGYCFPTDVSDLSLPQQAAFRALKAQLLNNPAGSLIQNMVKASTSIYIGMAMSVFWCIAFIYVLSAFAEEISWGIIVLTQIGLFVGAGLSFW